MKTLTTIAEWMSTNPTKDEVEKVMKLINRMNVSKIRREVWENERSLRRLLAIEKRLKEVKVAIPNEVGAQIKELKGKIEVEKKSLPVVKKRAKKEE